MIEKTITVCGKPVHFKASAAIPRLYRAKFKRDIFKDLAKLESAAVATRAPQKANTGNQNRVEFQIEDLEIFENIAYLMAYHADHSVGSSVEDWLDQFDMFSIYEILPEILTLWGDNMQTEVESKKNLAKVSGR